MAICKDIVSKIKDGENEEEVEIPDEIPGYILEQILLSNRKEQDDTEHQVLQGGCLLFPNRSVDHP